MVCKSLDFNDGWRFCNDWNAEMAAADFDDAGWRVLDLPHDWSIEGTFSPDAPAYCRGAYLPTGKGCYRKRFRVPEELKQSVASVYFGGIFRDSEIFVNGRRAGGRPWGYIGFETEIQGLLRADGENTIAVKVDNSRQPGCRWYAGSGIYRDVRLHFRDPIVHFPLWSAVVTTPEISETSAHVALDYTICNRSARRIVCEVEHAVFGPDGRQVAVATGPHTIGAGLTVVLRNALTVADPVLWDLENPALYTWRSRLTFEGREADVGAVRFGIRSMRVDPGAGFSLNGRPLKIKGVCLHNDGGGLGAACGRKTFTRQLQILKSMGCNAVRTAHHPFSEAFLDACDEQGVLVLAEAFDEWQEPIRVAPMSDGEPQSLHVNYYAGLFDAWAQTDLADMVRRDRNHPAIFMWSIGNEVPQMHKESGFWIAGKLQEIVHSLDDRPVTCAVVAVRPTPRNRKTSHRNIAQLDVGGYNYPNASQLDDYHQARSDQPLIVTECYSAQTRRRPGVYHPAGPLPDLGYRYPSAQAFVEAFENMARGMDAWEAVRVRPFAMGLFIWTGWDYLGEPTPYDYPAHASFFGVVDTCGFPKDGYFYYRSVWRDEPLVHLATHWDFKLGEAIDVRVISNCPEVELSLNGTSLGTRTADEGFVWAIDFAPGELKVMGLDGGMVVAEARVHTSGLPVALRLTPYFADALRADGRDLEYIQCEILDADGRRVLNADTPLRLTVTGPGHLAALDNGDPFALDRYQGTAIRCACAGRCLCIVRAGRDAGSLDVRAEAPGLPTARLTIPVKGEP